MAKSNFCNTKHQSANAALSHFLNGERFSRLNLPEDVGCQNSSLHSIVSTIQNKYFIPIASDYNAQGVCEYWMEAHEIDRFYNDREEQRQQMKDEVQLRGIIREGKSVLRLAERLATNSDGIQLLLQALDGKGRFAELVAKAANEVYGNTANQGGVV